MEEKNPSLGIWCELKEKNCFRDWNAFLFLAAFSSPPLGNVYRLDGGAIFFSDPPVGGVGFGCRRCGGRLLVRGGTEIWETWNGRSDLTQAGAWARMDGGRSSGPACRGWELGRLCLWTRCMDV